MSVKILREILENWNQQNILKIIVLWPSAGVNFRNATWFVNFRGFTISNSVALIYKD